MSSRRRRAKRNRYLIGAAVGASALLLAIAAGWYPLALVNGKPIWASSYRAYVASAIAYQQAARDTYATSSPLLSAQGERALGAVALDELVEQKLLQQGMAQLVGDHADQLVENKMADLAKEPQLVGASRALFQLDPQAFRRVVLRPQAMREVLSGRLYLDGTTLEAWTEDARRGARVRLLTGAYGWQDRKVQAR